MTSLAKQLQQLAVPHTQAVFGHDHSKPSLLFDPREAAQLDKETFYALGLNGLEELENIDVEFEKFEDTLFSESSQTFERSIQTKEANKKLDENISEFLIRLSPYFLLKPSHKALEWLIYRYHIHHYNEDELMRCILPYHETKIFVRAIQILKLDRPDTKWDWLQPLQKSGVHLPKSTLINHCKTNRGFLGFLCETVQKFVKLHVSEGSDGGRLRVLFSFFTSTVVGVLEIGGATEMTISTLVPHITRGLKSKLSDHKAASYMILSQLVNKVKIKTSVLQTLLRVMAKHLSASLLHEAFSCMVLMYQTQKIETFPKKALKYMCRVSELTECMSRVCQQYQACGLTRAVLVRLIPLAVKRGGQSSATSSEGSEDEQEWTSASPQYCHLLEDFIRHVPLSDQTASFAARCLVEAYTDRLSELTTEDDQADDIDQSLKDVVRILESRYSAALDSAMESLLTEAESDQMKELIQKFVSLTLTSIQHHVIADDCSNLTLALCHRLGGVRKEAVNHLVQNLDQLQEDDQVFIERAVLAGLRDDHFPVVKATLQIGKKLWSLVSDKEQLVSTLTGILQKGGKKVKRKHTLIQAMAVLCSCDADSQIEVFRLVYPYLLVVNGDGIDVAMVTAILESDLATSHPLLCGIKQVWLKEAQDLQKGETTVPLNVTLVNSILQTINTMEESETLNLVTELLCCRGELCVRPRSSEALTIVILDGMLGMESTSPSRALTIAMAQLNVIRDSLSPRGSFGEHATPAAPFSVEAAMQSVLTSLSVDKPLQLPLCAGVLLNVINSFHLPPSLVTGSFWYLRDDPQEHKCLKLLVRLFDLLLELAAKEGGVTMATFRSLIIHTIEKHFSEPAVLIKFLCLLWSYHSNDQSHELGLNLTLQVRGLHIGQVQLEQLEQQHLDTLLQMTDPVFTQLLVGLTSPLGSVREMVCKCLQALETRCEQTPYLPVIKRLVKCREEIVADQEFLGQALLAAFGKLSETDGDEQTERKTRRKSGSRMAARMQALTGLLNIVQREDTPIYVTQNVLHSLRLLNSPAISTQLLPLLRRLLNMPTSDIGSHQVKVIHQLIGRFTPETGKVLEKDSLALALLMAVLLSEVKVEGLTPVQDTALSQITKELHDSLPSPESKKRLLSCLLDVLTRTKSVTVGNLVRKVLKHVSLDGGHISEELALVLQAVQAGSVKEAKRLRTRGPAQKGEESEVITPELENVQWQRVTHLLEVIQIKKKVINSLQLIPVCFQLVARVLELEDSGSGEYLKQLILSCILNISSRQIDAGLDSELVKKREFNMELIIQCIRSSDNPQTHHHALLLLTVAAKLQPEHLLHNVMSIFTFMGANILRQDDSYSFRVISKILETVIPALVTACEIQSSKMKKSSTKVEEVITMVIRVFVDAYPHIPGHRRPMLFTKLVGVLGEAKYLWRMLLMLTDHMISRGGAKTHQDDQDDTGVKSAGLVASADLDFFLGLCATFPSGLQLLSAKQMLVYVSSLSEDRQGGAKPSSARQRSPVQSRSSFSGGMIDKVDSEVFRVDTHSAKQLRHFKYAAVSLLVSLFESDSFIGQVANSEDSALLGHYEEFLKTILEYVTQLNKSVESNQDKSTSRFWRALQHKVYDLLDKVVSLLPDGMFYEVVSGLMKHSLPHVQRKAMELLNTKLQTQKDTPSDTEGEILLKMVEELSDIAETNTIQSGHGEDKAVNGQTALFSLKLLCRHLGNQHPKPFLKVLELATKVFHRRRDNPQVAACGLLYVAEACNSLKVHVIQHLSAFLPKLVKVLQKEKDLLQHELLTLSAITAVHKVVENLTHFLSPYLLDIITCVCSLTTSIQKKPKLQKPQLQFRLTAVRGILANSLPTRVLLPNLISSYDLVSISKQDCIVPMMQLLSDHISHMEKEELNSHNNQILSFFYICLDFRVTHAEVAVDTVYRIEASVIDAIITMVMKLSEATFRPMIFKLCDWATRSEENKGRILVFYRLADSFAEKLRSLFTLFAGHIIKHTARMLDENNVSKQEDLFFGKGKKSGESSSQLLQYLLDYLYKCFLYDNEGFVNKERFDTLMQPLADQIENMVGGEAVYEERVLHHLVPCVAQFAVAAQDDASWRSLNYQILLKTRSSQPKVRYAALMVLDELHKKLGEDSMTLLPETIPFLAELMEDDSEEVEKKCQSVIAEMEKTLGEPLQKYF